jgi:hypothetical protein
MLTQKIKLVPINLRAIRYFLHEVQFFAGIRPAHFPAETTRPLGRGCLPFSPSFSLLYLVFVFTFEMCVAKLRKRYLALSEFVSFCRFLSVFVSFCRFSEQCFFLLQSYKKRIWQCHDLSLFVTFCHFSVNCSFTVQSYEIGIWHCPHLSAYVRKCPLMSAISDIATSSFTLLYNNNVLFLVKMASSLASIAETWPENCDLQ